MTSKSITFIVLALFLSLVNIQSQEIIIDTEFGIEPESIVKDHNGDFVITANWNDTTWFWKAVIVKVTPDLDTTVKYIYDTLNTLFSPRILVTQDNKYLIHATERLKDSIVDDQLVIMSFEENINMLSFKRYNMQNFPGLDATIMLFSQNNEGRIYGFGTKQSSHYFVAMEITDAGDTIRTKTINASPGGNLFSGILKSNNDSVALYSFGAGYDNSGKWKVFTLDTALNLTYKDIILGTVYNYIQDVHANWLNDSIYMGVGFLPYGANEFELALYKANANQNHEPIGPQLQINNPDWKDQPAKNVPTYVDLNFIYVGSYRGSSPGASYNGRYMVAIVDHDLNLIGMKSLGKDGFQYDMMGMQATDDLGCIVTGTVHDNENAPSYDWDMFIRKIMPDQIVEVAENTDDPYDSDYFLYPNPGTDILHIQTARQGVKLEMVNSHGNIVLKQVLAGGLSNTINTGILPSGTYVLHFTDREAYYESLTWIKI